jgi:hypothetical protein
VADWQEFLAHARIGPVPPPVVLVAGIAFNITIMAVGLLTAGLRQSSGEVFSGSPAEWMGNLRKRLRQATWEAFEVDFHLPQLPGLEQRKQMAYVISDEVEAIGQALIKDLQRGATLLHGKGIYTGKEHGVLLCAITARQLEKLRQIVNKVDPRAFVIVTPVQEVRGQGFRPLEA